MTEDSKKVIVDSLDKIAELVKTVGEAVRSDGVVDLTDPRNWKKGDLLECVDSSEAASSGLVLGKIYEFLCLDPNYSEPRIKVVGLDSWSFYSRRFKLAEPVDLWKKANGFRLKDKGTVSKISEMTDTTVTSDYTGHIYKKADCIPVYAIELDLNSVRKLDSLG